MHNEFDFALLNQPRQWNRTKAREKGMNVIKYFTAGVLSKSDTNILNHEISLFQTNFSNLIPKHQLKGNNAL